MTTKPLRRFYCRPQYLILAILILLAFAPRINAFSLIGPYTDWMVQSNSYRQAGDIGGPMNLNEEYRWNVPTITYGFDKSFVDYFGSNGVAAVESAIQILNALPASSDTILNDYPLDTRRANPVATAQNVYDLRSVVLALLVEQMGLGQPTRNVFDLPPPGVQIFPVCTNQVCPAVVIIQPLAISRNFDPETLGASFVVNGTQYSSFLSTNDGQIDQVEFPINPLSPTYSAVADAFSLWYSGLQPGSYYTGLTRDDVGGLAYLLNTTNVNWESLPKNVLFVGHQHGKNKKLRGTRRPGVEKINFVPQPEKKRDKFKTIVFKYTANYVTNGTVLEQSVKRVVSQPDILFAVAETFQSNHLSPMFLRTGTEKWLNNAAQNGNALAAGPGVIDTQVRIALDKLGPTVYSGGPYTPAVVMNSGWASFDESTNPPVSYPQNSGQTDLSVRLNIYHPASGVYAEFTNSLFNIAVPFGGPATLQISTNNADWNSLATVTNNGSVVRWNYFGTPTPVLFRVLPGAQ